MSEEKVGADEQVQALNYAAHALEDLARMRVGMQAACSRDVVMLDWLLTLVRRSVKFVLPNCADMLDIGELRQAHLDLVRMPYPITLLEIPWRAEHITLLTGALEQGLSTRRIALCVERAVLPDVMEKRIRGHGPDVNGVLVIPIPWFDEFCFWGLLDGACFIPYGGTVEVMRTAAMGGAHGVVREALTEAGVLKRKKFTATFDASAVVLFDEWFSRRLTTQSMELALAAVWTDLLDEVTAVVKFANVINCANVAQATLSAPAALNRKRASRGKPEFFEYKVLDLNIERGAGAGRGPLGHDRAGPRMHLRRGHIRRLEDYSVWVRAAMVSSPEKGVLKKDYRIGAGGTRP